MARSKTHTPLAVLLNGRLVGRLNRQPSGAIDFAYDPAWLAWEHAIPVSRSMPLRPERYAGENVIAVFDNLLPDNDAIRRRLAERVGAPGVDAFSLLSAVGRDCVGALQFVPENEAPGSSDEITGKPISRTEIAELLRNLGRAPLGLDEEADFRISLAGAQEKTALLFHNRKWHKPTGATPTTHILKPIIGKLPNGLDLTRSVENEYLCMQLTRALGLPTAKVEMADFGDQRALVIERFDRLWTESGRLLRLPQEDCCQALSVPPTRKYEAEGGPSMLDVLDLLKESDTPREDQAFFLRAQIVFWMIGATDGHAKNFSLFLGSGGRFRVTPLYDVLSVLPNYAAGQVRKNQMKLAMAADDNRHYTLATIQPRHFAQTAKKAGISEGLVEEIFGDLAERIPEAIQRIEKRLPKGFPATVSQPILKALRRHAAR